MYSKSISTFRKLLINNLDFLPEEVINKDRKKINLQEKLREILEDDMQFMKLIINMSENINRYIKKLNGLRLSLNDILTKMFNLPYNATNKINVDKKDDRSLSYTFSTKFRFNSKLRDKNYTLELDNQIKKAFYDHNLNCGSSKLCNMKNPENSKNIHAVVKAYTENYKNTLFMPIPKVVDNLIEKNLECSLTFTK